ncbi:MAG TPA: NrfD/PsrC family molybdoenzyme membrane anchor subunit [Candidatus Limnocylindria bacterium]|nr:NrfD/PsrC family molybdoenzyme membrane anchor subunit [Candidatus Limnocylindria bacterium]
MTGAEHFAAPPNWEWWILAYFVFGGIAGGSYAIGTLIRLVGSPEDQRLSRIAYVTSFIALLPCPIFLIADLGQPLRFVNMLLNTSDGGLGFKYWSPMSLGSWVLLGFGLFSFVSFLGALGEGGTRSLAGFAAFVRGALGRVWGVIGTGLGFFIAGYTGVLLSVSNQPVWSDAAWVLGGLFLASGLTGSAALLIALAQWRKAEGPGTHALEAADRNFAILETILLVLFVVSVAVAGTIGKVLGVWLILWVVVLVGLAAPFVLARRSPMAAPAIALLGLIALRAVVIFAAQA